jgi:hypothetical protein
MAGFKNLCVFNDRVYEIPLSKSKNGKMVEPKLSGQTVLSVELVYSIQNRKPYEIIRIVIDRITFDNTGIFDISAAMLTDEFGVVLEYAHRETDKAIGSISRIESRPLPIPKAPIIPTNEELSKIKEYLNQKYPLLLKNSPYAIEHSIQNNRDSHKKKIQQMKKSYLNR